MASQRPSRQRYGDLLSESFEELALTHGHEGPAASRGRRGHRMECLPQSLGGDEVPSGHRGVLSLPLSPREPLKHHAAQGGKPPSNKEGEPATMMS